MQNLIQDIKNKEFKSVYLLYGEEGFLKKSYKNRLKEAIIGDDTMNYHYFEGKGLNLSEIIGLANTMPFFADRRLIQIEDSGLLKSGGEELCEYLPDIPETTTILLVESEIDKRSRLYKAIGKLGYAAEMKRQTLDQLSKWAGGLLAKEHKKITHSTMDLFLSKTGDDMELISSELEKLISYTYGRDVIADKDVETICVAQVTNQIFEMVGAIATRQTAKALTLYQDLLVLREPPLRILFLIARQFNQLLQVRDLVAHGGGKAEVASKLKVPPFVAGKLITQSKAFTRQQILDYVKQCVETEEAVKQGRMQDKLAAEILIASRI